MAADTGADGGTGSGADGVAAAGTGSGADGAAARVREMHLAVQLPRDPGPAGPPLDFAVYVRLARAAERGLFDFVLLNDGGGGPEPFTVLNALAAVTDRIGLAAGVTTAGRDPYDLARRIAALDRLSAGRAAGPALALPECTAPAGVVIGEGGPADVVVNGGRERTPPGAKVLARIGFTLTDSGPDGEFGAAPGSGPGTAADGGPGDSPGLRGTAPELADLLDARVRSGAVDGFLLLPEPALAGRGLDVFVDRVVPLLQERGSLRTAYRGTTLRDHLGLPSTARKAGAP